VEVQFVAGRDAVLTIFEDGTEREQVTLSDVKTKMEMHELMIQKGFERKSQEEIEALKVRVEKRTDEETKKLKQARELRDNRMRLRGNKRSIERNALEVPKQTSSRPAVEVQEQKVGARAPRQEVEAKMFLDGATEKVRTKPTGVRFLFPFSLVVMIAGFVLVKKRKAKKVTHAK
jgi:hypothetical protein